MWQAEADTEMTLSASPTTVGQKALAPAQKALFHGIVSYRPKGKPSFMDSQKVSRM